MMFYITQVKLLREYYMLEHVDVCLYYREEMCNKLTYSLYCAQLDKLSTQEGRALQSDTPVSEAHTLGNIDSTKNPMLNVSHSLPV